MTSRKSGQSGTRKFRAYITAVVLGIFASGAALLLSSLIIYLFGLPVVYGKFFALASFGAGSAVSGFAAGVIKRQNGIASGIKAALLFMLPIILISYITGNLTGEDSLTRFIAAVLCGAAGGVIGVNKNNGF